MKKIQALILAAGKGKRMGGGDMPKVLQPILGRPMIVWILESVRKSGVDDNPALVVGYGRESVEKTLGRNYTYIHQKDLFGTGHAVRESRGALEDKAENILVLYGDHAFISAKVIGNLAETHLREGKVLTMMTTTVPDFNDWRAPLRDFGRIARDASGRIVRIIEVKDATPEEREIRELNPAMYCFRASWLWPRLEKLENKNAQGEYYLTDLPAMAISEGEEVSTVPIDPKECLGVNSREQLELVEKLFAHLKK